MKPGKAIEILKDSPSRYAHILDDDTLDAQKLGQEALARLLKMRSYNINQAIMPLPGER